MTIYKNPRREDWKNLLKRPTVNVTTLEDTVRPIFLAIQKQGNKAVRKYSAEFDKCELDRFEVSEQEIYFALNKLDSSLFEAIKVAADNITAFHKKQVQPTELIETMPGVTCWRKSVGIEKVGLYIPGGTAPLFSTVLMLAIPAIIAGCRQIIMCTPPSKDGSVHPAILVAAHYIGVKHVFKVGGVQAIAAMTFGTETIPAVHKLFGPGNQYVTAAKQLAQKYGVSIDMPAGPSEVAVFADSSANPAFVAADLLSQAEHGADSQVILVTDNEQMIINVTTELDKQLESLPRREFAQQSLSNSKAFLVQNPDEALNLLNEYAPEHLILNCENALSLCNKVINAGSVFVGSYSPESVGDYASGTNHTLPTNGYAKSYSGVSVDSFVRKITFQQLTKDGLINIAGTVEAMAEAEGLKAHAEAVRVRRSS